MGETYRSCTASAAAQKCRRRNKRPAAPRRYARSGGMRSSASNSLLRYILRARWSLTTRSNEIDGTPFMQRDKNEFPTCRARDEAPRYTSAPPVPAHDSTYRSATWSRFAPVAGQLCLYLPSLTERMCQCGYAAYPAYPRANYPHPKCRALESHIQRVRICHCVPAELTYRPIDKHRRKGGKYRVRLKCCVPAMILLCIDKGTYLLCRTQYVC